MRSYSCRLIRNVIICSAAVLLHLNFSTPDVSAAVAPMNNYCAVPPFVAQSVPPLTMLVVGKDQNLFHQAYSDAADLDGDGKLDIDYTHSIDYYGYFDSYKCYTYDSSAGQFNPDHVTTDKFCTSGQWSGNVLNWITMSRMDVLRKVLYGGHRIVDSTSGNTVLQRAYIPMDSHSWGKELTGRLCNNGTTYTHSCNLNSDCDTGYTCVDVAGNGKYIIPYSAATSPTTCTAVATGTPVANKLLVTRYQHASTKNCSNVTDSPSMISSYEPVNLFNPNPTAIGTGLVQYVTGFDNATLSPSDNYADNYNILVVTNFTPDVSGAWQFAVDGDDSVEVQVGGTVVAQYLGCHGAAGNQSHSGTITLNGGTTYTIVARHFESSGGEGVQVWFKRPAMVGGTILTDTTRTTNDGTTKKSVATTACTAISTGGTGNGGTLTGGNTANPSICTASKPCLCTPNTPSGYTVSTSGSTLTFTPNDPTNATCTTSGTTRNCTPNNWAYVSSSSTTTGATTGLYAPLSLSAPNIVSGNECAVQDPSYVATGAPVVGNTVTTGTARQHLFCNTTLSDNGTPLMRVMTNMTNRIWDWSAKERPECNDTSHNPNSSYPFATNPADFNVKVSVCQSGLLESNCRAYGPSSATIYKPAGLLQKYGEGDGTKVCSKTYSQSCTDDSQCPSASDGKCIYKAPMYFGMTSGSYTNNLDGGVLRKNISSILDEVNTANGTFNNATDGIIQTFEQIKLEGYNYSSYAYDSTSNGESCGWIDSVALANGQCRNWGNPIAEMMYESIRYLAGKGAATTSFAYSGTTTDSVLNLPAPAWGTVKGSTTYQPYAMYPLCSRPFMLILSDVNTSYDGDKIPGSTYSTVTEDTATPTLGLGATVSGKTVLNTLVDTIGTNEGIAGQSWFIGQSGSTYDNLCTSKTVTNLSTVRGLCPLEPTKQGTYYSAALAYFGKNGFKAKTGFPDINTYSVAISPPFADLKIKAGAGYITFVPTAKSVSGCMNVYQSCAAKCTLSYDATGTGLTISSCTSDAFCPTNQVVNFFVDDIRYDSSNNVVYVVFRINYEDSEQGADYDMDAIVKYEVCTQAAIDAKYGSCGSITPALGSNIKINLWTEYGAGCIDQALGFTISGTTADGVYLPVKDGDVSDTANSATPAVVAGMPKTWSRVFTPNNTPTDFLRNPLWYAAKWGGFTDSDNSVTPNLRGEWAKNCTSTDITQCDPDNYYLVTNPLKLETQLDQALTSILAKTSSGTAASIVNNSGESGTNLLQAVFYPLKDFGTGNTVSWIGEMEDLWFYLDPYLKANTIREDTIKAGDTTGDKILDMNTDLIVSIDFDNTQNKTVVNRYNNRGAFVDQIDLDSLSPLWRAGGLLQLRDLTANPRTIKTMTNGTSLMDFNTTNSASLVTYLQATDATDASKVISYITGNDTTSDTTLRSRTVTFKGHNGPWRLGDIISSTPKVQGGTPMQGYDLDYNDLTYKSFWQSDDYKARGMVYVGANDGMLHAFKLGTISRISDTTHPSRVAQVTPNTSPPLGQEEWAYIPKNALPYLRYQMQPDYSHLYTVDTTVRLLDASINIPATNEGGVCTSASYWDCTRKTTTTSTSTTNPLNLAETSWRTVLIGGMGLGGSSRGSNGSCNSTTTVGATTLPDCVKTPITTSGYETVGLSSYFAMDVTTPTSPSFMWEFTDPGLGYTLSPPAIVRINGVNSSNVTDTSKNGRWFAVFASGPTGPLNTASHQFYGKSDQTLKLFIVDLKTGTLVRTIDTTIPNAFAGSLTSGAVDTDSWNPNDSGYYSTDVVYIGYTKYTSSGTWDGGVGRLVTKESTDPANWVWSKVVDGIGPVTTAVAPLQDRTNKKLWLYFGTGRYFFKDATNIDDADSQRDLYGVMDPCYPKGSGMTAVNDLDPTCTASVTPSSLTDQSDTIIATLPTSSAGWLIKLWPSNSKYKAERLLTNPAANYNGNVTFTTFMPTADICGFGGETFVWVVKGMTGGTAPASTLQGKMILQLSTGAFQTVDTATALKARLNRRTGLGGAGDQSSSVSVPDDGGYTGGTSKDTPPTQRPPKGVPRILQVKEK